jgi:cytochrome c551/c552
MRKRQTLICAALACVALCACGNATPEPTATPSGPDLNTPAGRGQAIFTGKGRCSTCHALTAGTTIVGPSLSGIATTAATRIPGVDAEIYLEESIVAPDRFRTPGFENVAMDPTIGKQLTTDEVADVVAFLLTVKAE